VKKLLFLGSSCIYPKNCPQPIKEEYLLTGELEQTNEPYALAKIAGIKMCESYFRQYGCDFISVMPTNLYGPNDNYNLETSHVLPALIRKIHLAHCLETGDWVGLRKDLTKRPIEGVGGDASDTDILAVLKKYGIGFRIQDPGSRMQDNGVEVVLWGTGKVYREFLHVDDMAAGCLLLMDTLSNVPRPTSHVPHSTSHATPLSYLNLGSGQDQTIEELSVLVRKVIGFRGEIRFDHIHADGTPKKLLDCSRIQALGFKPKYTLEQGIRMVYEAYVNES
jgi:GDP-L-fucose synthase